MSAPPVAAASASPFLEERHAAVAAEAARVAATVEGEHDPRAVLRALASAGLLAHCVPAIGAATGGRAPTVELRALCAIRERLAYVAPLADTLFAMQGLGSFPVTLAGTDEQRRALLPRVARGEAICAFAITEPDAGSDVGAISTTARRDGDHYVLDGDKTFISNAGLATSYVLFARTAPPGERKRVLSAFLLDGSEPGFSTAPLAVLGDHPIGTVSLRGVRVPASARLGEEGDGQRIALATLDRFRSSVGAAALGMAQRALDEALHRTTTRRQFGQPLADFQATQLALAEMALDVETARLLVEKAAWIGDRGEPVTRAAALAKLHATEAAQRVIDRAVQLHGGAGVTVGSVVERLYREVRALRIYEGTSEIQKLVIARSLLQELRQ